MPKPAAKIYAHYYFSFGADSPGVESLDSRILATSQSPISPHDLPTSILRVSQHSMRQPRQEDTTALEHNLWENISTKNHSLSYAAGLRPQTLLLLASLTLFIPNEKVLVVFPGPEKNLCLLPSAFFLILPWLCPLDSKNKVQPHPFQLILSHPLFCLIFSLTLFIQILLFKGKTHVSTFLGSHPNTLLKRTITFG